MVNLTASHVRYLMALKRLKSENGIKGAVIARELGLSRQSVHNMMDTFLALELVEKEPGGQVYLTAYGLEKASFFESACRLIREKLFAPFEEDESVDRAICAMVAELSEEAIRRLF